MVCGGGEVPSLQHGPRLPPARRQFARQRDFYEQEVENGFEARHNETETASRALVMPVVEQGSRRFTRGKALEGDLGSFVPPD